MTARKEATMNILQGIDAFSAGQVTDTVPLYVRLYHGHMRLVQTLMHAQTQLHESGYEPDVRSALVGPAHTAVMHSARALAHAATQHTPEEAP